MKLYRRTLIIEIGDTAVIHGSVYRFPLFLSYFSHYVRPRVAVSLTKRFSV
jgi:hypothetical protein